MIVFTFIVFIATLQFLRFFHSCAIINSFQIIYFRLTGVSVTLSFSITVGTFKVSLYLKFKFAVYMVNAISSGRYISMVCVCIIYDNIPVHILLDRVKKQTSKNIEPQHRTASRPAAWCFSLLAVLFVLGKIAPEVSQCQGLV